jgi:AraC family transcriptional regulator, positive regulator of tynA and feaB
METVFSTSEVHVRDRFDYWHDVACRSIVNHESQPECRLTFNAAIQAGALADIGLVVFENSPMDISRTPGHAAHATNDEIFLCRQLSGSLALEQNGRRIVLNAGDFTLIDPLLPYVGRFFCGSNLLVLKVPRRALEARAGKTREMVARHITACSAEASLTSSFLAMLPSHAGRMRPAIEQIIRDQVLDLVAASLTKMVIGTDRARFSSALSVVLMNVRAAIEMRLSDAALDTATVAAAAGISVRYANAVLAREGTSIMRLIQTRRLERCRLALEDRSQSHRTLSEIAYGWGFSDMTHFSRRFKATYGVLPSEYRRMLNLNGR